MNERRFPTIIGLLIIFVSLVSLVFLFKNARNFFSQASADATPTEVKITNLTDNSFTVSWITTGKVSGTINFGETSSLGKIIADDRDQVSGTTNQYQTHHLTLRYLNPATKYYFKMISGDDTFDKDGEPYVVTTAPRLSTGSGSVHPVYGTITKTDGTPAANTIVYLNYGQNTSLSTLVKSSGSWLITLNNARIADLTAYAPITAGSKIELFVQAGSSENAQAITSIGRDAPVPQITLGRNYDFTKDKALVDQSAALQTPTPTPLFQMTPSPSTSASPSSSPASTLSPGGFKRPAASFAPTLANPASGSAVPSDRPVFGGTGIPGKTIVIKIESSDPITGTTSVDQTGNWRWTPPQGLTPGEHTATITTTDAAGKTVTLIHKFVVLASGTSVVEAATPAATLRPSPTPTATPRLTPTPRPTVVPQSTAPATGNPTPTIFVLILGIGLLTIGIGRLVWPAGIFDK